MLLDLINLSKLRHAVIYALAFIALFILQDLLISRITLFGVHALIVPAAVVVIAIFDGGSWGGFLGLAVGYFSDLGHTETTFFFTVILTAAGFFIGVLGRYVLHRGFVSYMALLAALMTVITFCQMVPFLFFTDTASWPVWRTGLVQILWSLIWSVPVYFPFKAIATAADRRIDRSV